MDTGWQRDGVAAPRLLPVETSIWSQRQRPRTWHLSDGMYKVLRQLRLKWMHVGFPLQRLNVSSPATAFSRRILGVGAAALPKPATRISLFLAFHDGDPICCQSARMRLIFQLPENRCRNWVSRILATRSCRDQLEFCCDDSRRPLYQRT